MALFLKQQTSRTIITKHEFRYGFISKGISKTTLAKFVEKYNYERISHGIYCSPDVWKDGLYLLQLRCPKTIFSHDTALFLLDMTD